MKRLRYNIPIIILIFVICLSMIACETEIEKLKRLLWNCRVENDRLRSQIANHQTYLSNCRNELAQYTSRQDFVREIEFVKKKRTVKDKIKKSILDSVDTYNSFQNFIHIMFDDSIKQATSIYCSSYRIAILKDNKRYKIKKALINVFNNQPFLKHSVKYSSNCLLKNMNKGSDKIFAENCKEYNECIKCIFGEVSIPSAVAYKNDYRVYQQHVKDYFLECFIYDFETNHPKIFFYGNFNNQYTSQHCSNHYLKTVPNSKEARHIEMQAFGEEIIRSLKRLRLYKDKLPILEVQASKVSSFEALLRKMKNDINVDLLNPEVASNKVAEYEKFLNNAVQTISESKKEVSIDQLVDEKEVDELLKQF